MEVQFFIRLSRASHELFDSVSSAEVASSRIMMGGFSTRPGRCSSVGVVHRLTCPAVPDTGVVSLFGLHDELVGIGDPGSPFDSS